MAKQKPISRSSSGIITNFSGLGNLMGPTCRALTWVALVCLMAIQCILIEADGKLKQNILAGDGGPTLNQMLEVANKTTFNGDQNSSSKGDPQIHQIKNQTSTMNKTAEDKRQVRQPQWPSAATVGGGQLEAFSTDWTGLGDLEASDALKKMNRRSSEYKPLPADGSASFGALRKRRGRPQPTIMSKRASGQLYALQQVEAPTKDGLLGPIVLSRRTSEDLLDQQMMDDAEYSRLGASSETEGKETFPLFGEFGSKISSLTTRKTQPGGGGGARNIFGTYRARAFGGPMSYGVWSSDNDNEDDAVPISSQLLISPQQLSSLRHSVEDAIAASVATGGGGGAVQNEVAPLRWNGELGKPETVSTIMESLSSNYLPRIARKVLI